MLIQLVFQRRQQLPYTTSRHEGGAVHSRGGRTAQRASSRHGTQAQVGAEGAAVAVPQYGKKLWGHPWVDDGQCKR